ncbi:MAG TPA: flagellar protein FlbB [bacterium]|nr:flagellar protein FlbB [bacterium]
MTVWRRIRILPLLIIVSGLSFAVRLGEVVSGFSQAAGSALAQQEVEAEPPHLEQTEEKQADAKEQAGEEKAPGLPEKPVEVSEDRHNPELEKIEWRDAVETDLTESGIDMKLFEDLAERRKTIEKREKELMAREALMKAAEQELEQKFRELQILRGELEALLQKQSDEEEARIQSLVKIYEGMKSGDAARIFNSLEIDILVEVMSRMSERKLAPILADMNPDRAQAITILLAQQKQLPELSH